MSGKDDDKTRLRVFGRAGGRYLIRHAPCKRCGLIIWRLAPPPETPRRCSHRPGRADNDNVPAVSVPPSAPEDAD